MNEAKKVTIIILFTSLLSGCSASASKDKVYQIGETAKVDDFDFTLLDVEYGTKSSVNLSHEDFLLPEDNSDVSATQYEYADEGETFVVITYSMKYSGKENTTLTDLTKVWNEEDPFWLIYDDEYTIEDDDNTGRAPYMRNSYPEGSESVKGYYDSLWNSKSELTFKPLDDSEIKLREYIEVPSKVIDDKESSLILVKNIYGVSSPNSSKNDNGGIVRYQLR